MTGPDPDEDLEGAPSWLDGLAGHLAEQGLVTYRADGDYPPDAAWPVFLEHMPPEPAEAVALTGYAGDVTPVDAEPRVQVRVRGGPDPRTSRRKAEAVWQYLRSLVGGVELADGSWLVNAPDVNGAVTSLGRDANHRHEHVTNHRLTIGEQHR